jgi:hypothetical protein
VAAFTPIPTEEEAAAAGFSVEDYLMTAELWPENWSAWRVFCDISGQWRLAANGQPFALDYGPLFTRMDRLNLSADEWEDLFQDIRVLEAAALEASRPTT